MPWHVPSRPTQGKLLLLLLHCLQVRRAHPRRRLPRQPRPSSTTCSVTVSSTTPASSSMATAAASTPSSCPPPPTASSQSPPVKASAGQLVPPSRPMEPTPPSSPSMHTRAATAEQPKLGVPRLQEPCRKVAGPALAVVRSPEPVFGELFSAGTQASGSQGQAPARPLRSRRRALLQVHRQVRWGPGQAPAASHTQGVDLRFANQVRPLPAAASGFSCSGQLGPHPGQGGGAPKPWQVRPWLHPLLNMLFLRDGVVLCR